MNIFPRVNKDCKQPTFNVRERPHTFAAVSECSIPIQFVLIYIVLISSKNRLCFQLIASTWRCKFTNKTYQITPNLGVGRWLTNLTGAMSHRIDMPNFKVFPQDLKLWDRVRTDGPTRSSVV